jgi:hypothetical protein
MKANKKTIAAISLSLVLVVLVAGFGLSRAQRGIMHEKGMMGEMMGDMNKITDQCQMMMDNMDMMIGQEMTPGCLSMMNMRGMGMMMRNMSQGMTSTMESLGSMMGDPEMMKDAEMKDAMDGLHQQLMMMSENMQKAVDNMERMQKRIGEMETK